MTRVLPIPQQARVSFIREVFTGPIAYGNAPERPGHETVVCSLRPECAGCNMAAHGFLCHFSDGTCLKCRTPHGEDGTRHDRYIP